MYWKFIGGSSIQQAIKTIQKTPYLPIFDYAKESSRSAHEAFNYLTRMKKDVSANTIPDASFAIKYSSYNSISHIDEIIDHMIKANITTIILDAESDKLHDSERRAFDTLLRKYNQDNIILYKTYQLYRSDTLEELSEDLFKKYNYHGVKLTRGAYLSEDGHKNVIYKTKALTDKNFDTAVGMVLNNIKNNKVIIATHNNESIKAAVHQIDSQKRQQVSFAQLLGMNDKASAALHENNFTVYKYVPYGGMLETWPYLLRRLYEARMLKYI